MKTYFEVTIPFLESNYEKIYSTLYLHGINSILEENGVIKFFKEDESSLKKIIDSVITNCNVKSSDISTSKFQNKNWNNEWEKTIQPICIADKLVVTPSWKQNKIKKLKGQIVITIDPKMSFGTGHNETTQLMLEMMVNYISLEDKTMLDFGCGTSVLAIAGIKLGLKSAVAIDIDEDSIRDSNENISNNGVNSKIKLYRKDISQIKVKNFNVICANIISSVIIKNLKTIHNKLNKSGKLFLSGILAQEKDTILKSLKKNKFDVIEINNKAEWLGIYCIKK